MPLPSSGEISLTQVAGEFGVTGSYSLKSFYRGGGNVPDSAANSGIPTSGDMALTDFYSAESGGSDTTPDSLNWGNVTGDISGSNSAQTIAGIDTSVEFGWSFSGTGSPTIVANVDGSTDSSSPVTVANGNDVYFFVSTGVGNPVSGTITVTNVTDGGTVLDTFTVTLSGELDP